MAAILDAVEAFKAQVRKARNFFSEDEIQMYYEIGETIGSGFFATVYRATERKTGHPVAIKCIEKSKVADKFSMLEEEVSILQAVRHENCVQMLEIFESQTHVNLVMELVTGGELFDRIMELKIFNEVICAKVIRQICQSLAYLHDMGIVHRDLKPENILLDDPDLHKATVKITDFGLSKIMKGEKKFLHSRCGTPAYAAPELVEGKKYGAKVDMWAVGCLMYVMLCGSPPFKGRDTQELFVNICRGNYTLNSKPFTIVSAEAKSFIRKLLVLDPEVRLTAEQALKDPWLRGKAQRQESLMMQKELQHFKEQTEKAVRDYRDQSTLEFGYIDEDLDQSSEDSVSIRLGSSSMSSLRISDNPQAEAKGVVGIEVTLEAVQKMEEKYPDWPAFNVEYREGNLLGCRQPDQIRRVLSTPSTWKRRAHEAGYLRAFLLLISMHPRQRLGCAFAVNLDLSLYLWYGDPHREAWELISHNIEGLRRKTGGHNALKKNANEIGPFWWDTVYQVAAATLSHFWSAEKEAKNALKSVPNLTREQIREASGKHGRNALTDLEELFLELVFKKLFKASVDLGPDKYQDPSELEKADGADKMLFESLKKDISNPHLITRFLNFYGGRAFEGTGASDAFMNWAAKERQPTLSSVFLNKLPVRTLLPTVFTICLQRLLLAAVGISIANYWEVNSASFDGSTGRSSSSRSSLDRTSLDRSS
eukprot:CAMPEP_0201486926 /NCGR_PEP_ID=MMETSP0151_2-20130828/10950_1 /ASSEMBLY_ACC=CAM_ASM_000257 /TAXON_ID=200890 /ORGANISM="Paramoeba atlantica, Strain 621/1 / CCAP 1560/9" /LENGTH=705 /DNA_ID=CAMNT_0047871799 /DNA_START=73 /DNA_END=2187 /DNA_ORIENTATION=+